MQQSIYLVGFMGAGKTFVGKRLAEYLYAPFLDLDQSIERAAKYSINSIFAQRGAAYFRLLERRSLHDTALRPPRIIATGGGAPCFHNNMQWMNQCGLTIYLDVAVPVLVKRLQRGIHKRPLLHGLSEAALTSFVKKLLDERRVFYEQASVHYRIETDQQDTVKELVQQLDQLWGH